LNCPIACTLSILNPEPESKKDGGSESGSGGNNEESGGEGGAADEADEAADCENTYNGACLTPKEK